MWPDTLPPSLFRIRTDKGFLLLAKGHPASLLHPVPACFWIEAVRLAGSTPVVRVRGSMGCHVLFSHVWWPWGQTRVTELLLQNTDALDKTIKGNSVGEEAQDSIFWKQPSVNLMPSAGQGLLGLRPDFQSLPLIPAHTMGQPSVSQMFGVKLEAVQMLTPWSVLCVTWSNFELRSFLLGARAWSWFMSEVLQLQTILVTLLLIAAIISRYREAAYYLLLGETTQMVCKNAVELSKDLATLKLKRTLFFVFPSLFHFPERRLTKKKKAK